MPRPSYKYIAEWYDRYLQERPVYDEMILPICLERIIEPGASARQAE